MHFRLVAASVVAITSFSAASWARDPASAEALYRSGKEAAKKGDWATACARFGESHRLDPAPGTLINLADCEEKRGLIASAWTHFIEVEPQFKPNDARAKFARAHAAALEKRVPRITIKLEGAPPEARVFRDDVELQAASLGVPLPVEPGAHVVIVKVGAAEKRFPVTATESTTTDVIASAPPPPEPETKDRGPPPPSPSPEAPPPKPTIAPASPSMETPPRNGDALGWVLAGAGGIGIGLGAVTGAMALSNASTVKDACGPDYSRCNVESVEAASSGRTFATVSTISFIAGGALAAVGFYFLFRTPAARNRASAWVLGGDGLRGGF